MDLLVVEHCEGEPVVIEDIMADEEVIPYWNVVSPAGLKIERRKVRHTAQIAADALIRSKYVLAEAPSLPP
jgi:hypothetical protein